MKGQFRLPDFSVVVWIKMTEHFPAVRSEVLSVAGREPYEMTEHQGMCDFHWSFTNFEDARRFVGA